MRRLSYFFDPMYVSSTSTVPGGGRLRPSQPSPVPCGCGARYTKRSCTPPADHASNCRALLRVDNKGNSHEPFFQRQVRIVEDGPFGHGELLSAVEAHIQDAGRNGRDGLGFNCCQVDNSQKIRSTGSAPDRYCWFMRLRFTGDASRCHPGRPPKWSWSSHLR